MTLPPVKRDIVTALSPGGAPHVGGDRGPLHLGQAVLVLRQNDAPGVAESTLVVQVQQEACDVAQVEPPEAPDRGVGLEAVAQRALLVVEAELLDQRAVQHDQGLRPRRVAGMLDAVLRIGHRLDQRDQDRHVFRSAAGHHAVHRDVPHRGEAVVGQKLADRVIGRQVGEGQELGDLLLGRRHDGQPVAPAVLEEKAIDLLEAAVEHDLVRLWIGGGLHRGDLAGEVADHVLDRGAEHIGAAARPRSARRHVPARSPARGWDSPAPPKSSWPGPGSPRSRARKWARRPVLQSR